MTRAIAEVEIQVLVDNNAGQSNLLGEHGFSALVTVTYDDSSEFKFLYDSGAGSPALDYNIKVMERDLSQIEMIILSHGHYDHSAGLLKLIEKLGRPVPVLCHPDALLHKIYPSDDGKEHEIGIHSNYNKSALTARTKIIETVEPYLIFDGIMTTGVTPRRNDFEVLTGVLEKIITVRDDKRMPDLIEDDLSVIFHLKDDSLLILTGCCHSGIVNTIERAFDLTGSKSKIGIIGGLHLHNASDKRLEKTIESLNKYSIKTLAACHCTGLRGRAALMLAFGESFKDIKSGSTLKFTSE
ncbi:MAG: MBL fold metallo-hydrolase [Candidatus Thorarchaeota archaeon]